VKSSFALVEMEFFFLGMPHWSDIAMKGKTFLLHE
jgi:hypothetical protein